MTAALLVAAWLALVVILELRDRPEVAVWLLALLLLLDAGLYASGNDVPTGLFHPQLAGRSLRLPDLLVPATLLGVGLAGRRRAGTSGSGLIWGAFLAWLAAEALLGRMAGNSAALVEFEAKAIIYLGAMALTARVPAERYTEEKAFRLLLYPAAALALLLVATNTAHVRIRLSLPGLPVPGFGELGADAASLFAALGVIGLTVSLCDDAHRLRRTAAGLVLLLPAIASGQRAAAVGAAVSLLVVAVALPAARRRLRVRRRELALAAAAAITVVLLPATVVASLGRSAPISAGHTPSGFVASDVQKAFQGQGKRSSAESRLNQWRRSLQIVSQAPLLGHGLGNQYVYFDPGLYAFVETDLSHDVPLDLLRRTGVVGLALFLVALAGSLARGFASWRLAPDTRRAALALACTAVVCGLVGKSFVESVFEKYRLLLLLGLVLGMVHSAVRGDRPHAPATVREGEPRDD